MHSIDRGGEHDTTIVHVGAQKDEARSYYVYVFEHALVLQSSLLSGSFPGFQHVCQAPNPHVIYT